MTELSPQPLWTRLGMNWNIAHQTSHPTLAPKHTNALVSEWIEIKKSLFKRVEVNIPAKGGLYLEWDVQKA